MLEIKDLHVHYGAIHALKGISLTVDDGELVSLIGANGAGKTTTLHTISGLLTASSGEVLLDGENIQKIPANTIIQKGMAHVPEGGHVFARMTVEENLRMGAYIIRDQKRIADNLEKVYGHFPRLKERRRQLAGTLSGGEQQMLATGRALMTDPKILLMDEPSMGLSPILVKEIFSIIQTLHESGITILLVEQNAKMALGVSDRAYVLETGKISMEGSAAELAADDRVRKAYLGA
ncbi:MAG: ABC transporter ATP-binding protein [Lachnospiraceae bacterium]|nr:ABC transporter ATP-binding protein [Lachnospiraceae bacterium]